MGLGMELGMGFGMGLGIEFSQGLDRFWFILLNNPKRIRLQKDPTFTETKCSCQETHDTEELTLFDQNGRTKVFSRKGFRTDKLIAELLATHPKVVPVWCCRLVVWPSSDLRVSNLTP